MRDKSWALDESSDFGARLHRRRLLGFATLTAMVLLLSAGFLLLSPRVVAKQKFMSLFAQAYPAAAGTPLDSCLLCHTNPAAPDEDNLNRYGRDWEDGDLGDKKFLAGALVRRDSDGDGIPNGEEIQQLSFPGNASSSTPPTTATTIPGTPPNGQALFAAGCAACHGPGGGDLAGTALGRSTFISITRNGQGTMPAQSGLSIEEAGAIWDYVTGAVPPTTTTTQPGATTTTTTPRSGAAVYAASCATCHGTNGGNIVPTTLSRTQLTSIITNGTGTMRGFPELGTTQITNTANYLLGLSVPTTTQPGATTTTTTPRSGAAVYAASCATCHGTGGGNLQGNTLTRSQIVSITTNGVGTMSGYATRLSTAEISNVAGYVSSIGSGGGVTTTTAAPGTPVAGATLYLQGCSACHGVHGEGGAGGPVAGTTLSRSETIAVIGSGIGTMPGYDTLLSPEEIEAIADHILGIGAGPGTSVAPGTVDTTVPPGGPESTTTTTTELENSTPVPESGDPVLTLGAPPIEPAGGNPLTAVLVGLLGTGAVVMWVRSLRGLTQWSRGD